MLHNNIIFNTNSEFPFHGTGLYQEHNSVHIYRRAPAFRMPEKWKLLTHPWCVVIWLYNVSNNLPAITHQSVSLLIWSLFLLFSSTSNIAWVWFLLYKNFPKQIFIKLNPTTKCTFRLSLEVTVLFFSNLLSTILWR